MVLNKSSGNGRQRSQTAMMHWNKCIVSGMQTVAEDITHLHVQNESNRLQTEASAESKMVISQNRGTLISDPNIL